MRHEVPAALPLIAFVAGLAAGPVLVHPILAATGLAAIALLVRHPAPLFASFGVLLAIHVESQRAGERRVFETFHEERFVTIVAPLERDWSPRGTSNMLRAGTFTANGMRFREAIAIYARFEPPPIGLQSHVTAEGLLRRNERGYYTLTLKSPLLMSYGGELRGPARWNRRLANRLRPHATRHPVEVALIEALVLGRGERLTDEVRDSFKRGGTYHLLVFSGLQIAFAAALIAALLRWLHAPRASDWLLLAFSVVAPMFIGPTASVARASTGIGLYAVARLLRRPTSLENLWCVAAMLRLAIEPRDLTDPSFHLTYAGAAALLFIGRNPLAAEVAITPLTLFHFHQFAIGGSLLTLAMSPLVFAMLIVSTLACAAPSDLLFRAIGALHQVCAAMNVAAFSGFFTAPPAGAMITGFALAMLALLLPKRRAMAMTFALTLPLIAALLRSSPDLDHPRLIFLDVGQGDAIVVQSAGRTMLVDGGGQNESSRFGETRLLPMLLDRGIRRVDVVALSHAHPDHCGGLPAVVEHLEVGEVWISPRRFRGPCAAQLLEACRVARTPIRLFRESRSTAFGEAVVAAHVADRTFRRASENNASMVLHLRLGKRRILLTGDIEREAEVALLDTIPHSDVLKVAHHGSRSSSTAIFLDATRPRVAVISCGRRNLFGHPHPSVLEMLSTRGVRVWRTDLNGSIEVTVAGGRIEVRPEIDTRRPHAYRE